MIQINPDKIRVVQLTAKEQKTILRHCHSMDRDLYERIRTARNGVLHLLEEECDRLGRCINVEADRATIPKVKDILGRLHNRLSASPVARVSVEELEGCDFRSIEEVNERLRQQMDARNATPDPDMGGLSPNQVTRLVYFSWDDERFPLRFNTQLRLSDLKHSVFFTNAAILLKALVEQSDQNTATAAGNLNRSFVKLVFDRLLMSDDHRRTILEFNKVINEQDVWALHIARVVCQAAGLVHRKKNKFLVPKKHHSLLSDERAGELYALLFRAYFTELNLGYGDRLPTLACIQHTIPYSVYRLGRIADRYRGIEELARQILLPAVEKQVREAISSSYLKMEWILGRRIIEPLEKFGLLECKRKQHKGHSEIEAVRKTELLDRFIRCAW